MKVIHQKNSVQILSGRERGAQGFGSQRLLQQLVEDKTRWMKWESQKVELPDSPRSTFLLAFSPDRTLMASTHVNHNIYITEVKTGKCIHSLVGHRRTPWCVTFHPIISGLVASGCLDGEVRIWDLHGGSESWFTESNVAIASLAFHPTAQLLLIATNNEIHFWDWSRREPFAVVKTASEMERVRLVRFDPLGHNLLTAIVNPSNQQNDDDSEIPMDSVEMPHLRQRSFLQSQPVRRTPLLHNFLHMLSSRTSGTQAGEQSQSEDSGVPPSLPSGEGSRYTSVRDRPAYQGCVQHLGMVCFCSRCSVVRPSSSSPLQSEDTAPSASSDLSAASTFSSARTEPRLPPERPAGQHEQRASERPSAFITVHGSTASNSLQNLSSGPGRRGLLGLASNQPMGHQQLNRDPSGRLAGTDCTGSMLNIRTESVGGTGGSGSGGGGMPPPRTSTSSVSLLSVLRQQEGSSQAPVYTSATEGRGFPGSSNSGSVGVGGEGTQSSQASIRNVLQCNLSRYFMEYDRMQDMDQGMSQGEASQSRQTQELLNNNTDTDRPGPSHYQPPHSSENNSNLSRGHLNRCRACHNLLTFNHDTQRWERTGQAASSATEESTSWQPPNPPFEGLGQGVSQPHSPERRGSAGGPDPSSGAPSNESSFPRQGSSNPQAEQTLGLVYNQEIGQWERVYGQSASSRTGNVSQEALNQEMPEENSDEDSLRRRLLESSLISLSQYDMSGSHDHPIYPDPARDNGERARHRVPRNARMSAPSLGRFVPRRFLLPEYLPYAGIFHERGQPGLATHSSVNRVLAGAVIGDGQSAVASNIANTTYRLQWWDFTKFDLPEISNASNNVLVQNCKIYNDASCDISADGQLLAVFIPSSQRGFPDEGILAVYSLAPHNLGEMLYTKRFASNNVLVQNCKIYNDASCDISADGQLLAVFIPSSQRGFPDEGILAVYSLAPHNLGEMLYTKRFGNTKIPLINQCTLLTPSSNFCMIETTERSICKKFGLQKINKLEYNLRDLSDVRVFNVLYPMPADQRRHVSINSARWLPEPGLGLAYGTNKGDLVICRPVASNSGAEYFWDQLNEANFTVNNNSGSSNRSTERPGYTVSRSDQVF
ncbi:UNVERIFIED_CONTAM: hypothetical protein FKN15_043725 [Acipenser sinensis]